MPPSRYLPTEYASSTLEEAQEDGFQRCARELRSVLFTTPLGWVLVLWLRWDTTPHERLALWLTGFVLTWGLSLVLLHRLVRLRRNADVHRDGWMLYTAAALDGLAWASMLPILAPPGAPDFLWLLVILSGDAAVTAPVYAPHIRAHFAYLGGLFLVVLANYLIWPMDIERLRALVGLTLFLVLLAYYMHRVARDILRNMHLQRENEALTQHLAELLQAARHDAETDSLTGLANRRLLDSTLASQWQPTDRRNAKRLLSVMMLDIDYFKRINDQHGHDVGDKVLKALAKRMNQHLRAPVLIARYGGEEFTVLLPDMDAATAQQIGERLRVAVSGSPLVDKPPLTVTVSIGVAQREPGESTDKLLARADAALYQAKQRGRNRVVMG